MEHKIMPSAFGSKRMSNIHQSSIFTRQDASHITLTLYGLHAEACPLPGELDHNFHLRTMTGRAFVLKISHAGQQRDVLAMQNAAIEHLAAPNPTLILPKKSAIS